MSTYEDRIEALEQRVADIELERLYEQRKTATNTPSEQAYDAKQVNHRLTMLLGIISGQEHDIKIIKSDVTVIKEQVAEVKQDINDLHVSFDQRFSSLEGKFDQMLQQLTLLTKKPE